MDGVQDVRDFSRDGLIVRQVAEGVSLAEIGRRLGMSRERVRQLANRAGALNHRIRGGLKWKPSIDDMTKLLDKTLGTRACAESLHRSTEIVRRWRRLLGVCVPRGPSIDALTLELQGLARELGRTPGAKRINIASRLGKTHSHGMFVHRFGSIRAAQLAAGLIPNPRGGDRRRLTYRPITA